MEENRSTQKVWFSRNKKLTVRYLPLKMLVHITSSNMQFEIDPMNTAFQIVLPTGMLVGKSDSVCFSCLKDFRAFLSLSLAFDKNRDWIIDPIGTQEFRDG